MANMQGNEMDAMLPDREFAKSKGWTHQVQWIEQGNPCFHRCTSGRQADEWADKLQRQGLKPMVIDLIDALQLH
jgi:hypothetical protein